MRIVVIGGLGNVGAGIVRRFLRAGASVVAVSRRPDSVHRVVAELPATRGQLDLVSADLGDAAEAARLVASLGTETLDAVVVTVHAQAQEKPLLEWTPGDLSTLWQGSLLPHFNTASAFLPTMRPGSMFLGIGGGTADYVIPGIASLSLTQSAQRMMYRALAQEVDGVAGARVRELIIKSMVNGYSSRSWAKPDWLTDDEIGDRVFDIITNPESFHGPILEISVADRQSS